MITLRDLRRRPHISVSQIKTFVQCPQKFFFQYVERATPAFKPIALAFGTAWHLAVEALLEREPEQEVRQTFRDALVRQVQSDAVPVLFEDEEDLGACIDLGIKMLAVFHKTVKMPDQVVGTELPFCIKLVDPETEEVLPVPLIGAIDAVVEDQNKTTIWELKTAKKKWSQDQLAFDLQPTAYKMGARVHGFDGPEAKLIITTKTREPAVQEEVVPRSKAEEQELVRVAASVLRAIDAGVDHPVRGWQCRGCQHAGRCG